MIKAIIFDLDDTLVSIDEANFRAYEDACSHFGISIDRDSVIAGKGKSWQEFIPEIAHTKDVELVNKIHEHKIANYTKYIKYEKPIEHIIELLNSFKGKFLLAIATGASPDCVKLRLEHVGLDKKVDLVITAAEIGKNKPDPTIYGITAERLGVKPEECLVFEDSEIGIQSARAAGMQAIKIV